MRKSLRFFHPIDFIGIEKPEFNDITDDIYRYGFSLDLRTGCYYFTYDWGYGICIRLLGFGFEFYYYG